MDHNWPQAYQTAILISFILAMLVVRIKELLTKEPTDD